MQSTHKCESENTHCFDTCNHLMITQDLKLLGQRLPLTYVLMHHMAHFLRTERVGQLLRELLTKLMNAGSTVLTMEFYQTFCQTVKHHVSEASSCPLYLVPYVIL